MLKYFFAILIFLHGLIHCMGFVKAFGYAGVPQLSNDISKTAGAWWLMAVFLFVTSSVLLLSKKESWPVAAIAATVISQILIISVWKDARFGTVLNIIILIVAVAGMSMVNFDRKVKKEATAMLATALSEKIIVTKEMLFHLPPIVQHWLITAGIVGKEKIHTVRLKQAGEMRTAPGKKWMPFTATEYFTVDKPAFNWQTNVQMMPWLTMNGRDKFEKGNGEMLIQLAGLINAANAKAEDKINHAAMMRFLAEICWFPSAALAEYIEWTAIDDTSAKATMRYKEVTAFGIFHFDINGDMISFSGDRWYNTGKNATLEKWFIEANGYQSFHGIRIPAKCEVSWKLNRGDFNWLYLRVTDLEFNIKDLYK